VCSMPRKSDQSSELLPVTAQRDFALPLTIGVISDTHVHPKGGRRLPPDVLDLFDRFKVDLVVHAGDLNCEDVLELLAQVAPVIAVSGNNDNGFLKQTLPDEVRFRVGQYSVGVVHGHQDGTARQTAQAIFAGEVDLGIYGHSHQPIIDKVGETILFNPGSATDRRWNEHLGVGIIKITEEGIDPDLILFKDPAHLVNIKP
jgi:uncharacterized protein